MIIIVMLAGVQILSEFISSVFSDSLNANIRYKRKATSLAWYHYRHFHYIVKCEVLIMSRQFRMKQSVDGANTRTVPYALLSTLLVSVTANQNILKCYAMRVCTTKIHVWVGTKFCLSLSSSVVCCVQLLLRFFLVCACFVTPRGLRHFPRHLQRLCVTR